MTFNLTLKALFPLLGLLLFSLFSCAPPQKMTVVIKMMPAQEEHFKKNVIASFEKENNVIITVKSVKRLKDIPQLIHQNSPIGPVSLVKVPFEMTRKLAMKNSLLPLDKLLTPKEFEEVKKEYFLMDLTKTEEQYFYLPRKFETRMLVYIKSQVKDAVKNWEQYREEIQAALKRHNRHGLPTHYLLEPNPSEWDYFDIFVVGFYWKSKVIHGRKIPRIGHRGKKYQGTALRLMDRAYQFGAKRENILAMQGQAVTDAFTWEALYYNENIYNKKMTQEKWSGSDIWKAFGSGDVFLSFMTQIDAFFIHGAGTDKIPGFLKDPEDMGVALIPQAVSLELENGEPMRVGTRSITTGGWWWGIPQTAPSPTLSLKLARHITNAQNQIEGCSGFGMIPVRRDILSELGLLFGGGWISEIFSVASRQLVENQYTIIPLIEEFPAISRNYIEAFYEISVRGNAGPNGKVSERHIERVLTKQYVPLQQEILGSKYPYRIERGNKRQRTPKRFKTLNSK